MIEKLDDLPKTITVCIDRFCEIEDSVRLSLYLPTDEVDGERVNARGHVIDKEAETWRVEIGKPRPFLMIVEADGYGDTLDEAVKNAIADWNGKL